ncbi:uncharacterized protein F4822DRAFT_423913 [Hypoxylon trugodes]|uniref:uncharacterized protein n=1 Tax=Hypoxylon trugodes TaxID=326681 RepID=UPI002195BF6A|nr:uncharacterized protein F4822DRAFT_423913 [Hypoxylon trugodes]KAI1393444.1 hypothetical protein F4822DRAFT_423913 [Hypoxylon trugodes]
MTTPISICRGCSRHIFSLRTNQTAVVSRWLQPTFTQIGRRTFAIAKTKPIPAKQKKPSKSAPATPKAPAASPFKNAQILRMSYAQRLANKSSPVTLYEAAPHRIFLFSSYMTGLCCAGSAIINYYANVLHCPPEVHVLVPVAFGAMTMAMMAFGTRFALMPAGSIRSIKILPARLAKGKTPTSGAKEISSTDIPVRLQIEARRNLPFPFLPLRRFEADPNTIVMKAPMYNRKPAPTEYDKMRMKQEEEVRRKEEREYEMNHLMTAPFRHVGQAFGMLFKSFRRGLTGEGFAPIEIDGEKFKLDITSAYALEEGRALDRIARIEEDPALADALERLGIAPVYHMREVGKNRHQALWIEALEAKFEGRGEPFDRAKFDQILGSYEALADYPAAIFPAELLSAYPEASVILSVRHSEEAWLTSMETTLWHAHIHRPHPDPSPMAPLSEKYHGYCWDNDLPKYGIAAYRAHNELVRELVNAERERGIGRKFLEFKPGDGWVPLCKFLGMEDVPEGPFPRSDDWIEYKKMVEPEKEKEKKALTEVTS